MNDMRASSAARLTLLPREPVEVVLGVPLGVGEGVAVGEGVGDAALEADTLLLPLLRALVLALPVGMMPGRVPVGAGEAVPSPLAVAVALPLPCAVAMPVVGGECVAAAVLLRLPVLLPLPAPLLALGLADTLGLAEAAAEALGEGEAEAAAVGSADADALPLAPSVALELTVAKMEALALALPGRLTVPSEDAVPPRLDAEPLARALAVAPRLARGEELTCAGVGEEIAEASGERLPPRRVAEELPLPVPLAAADALLPTDCDCHAEALGAREGAELRVANITLMLALALPHPCVALPMGVPVRQGVGVASNEALAARPSDAVPEGLPVPSPLPDACALKDAVAHAEATVPSAVPVPEGDGPPLPETDMEPLGEREVKGEREWEALPLGLPLPLLLALTFHGVSEALPDTLAHAEEEPGLDCTALPVTAVALAGAVNGALPLAALTLALLSRLLCVEADRVALMVAGAVP